MERLPGVARFGKSVSPALWLTLTNSEWSGVECRKMMAIVYKWRHHLHIKLISFRMMIIHRHIPPHPSSRPIYHTTVCHSRFADIESFPPLGEVTYGSRWDQMWRALFNWGKLSAPTSWRALVSPDCDKKWTRPVHLSRSEQRQFKLEINVHFTRRPLSLHVRSLHSNAARSTWILACDNSI